MVVLLKDKKGVSIVNAFQKILDSSKRKQNKIWFDQGRDFCNCSLKMIKRESHRNVFNIQ